MKGECRDCFSDINSGENRHWHNRLYPSIVISAWQKNLMGRLQPYGVDIVDGFFHVPERTCKTEIHQGDTDISGKYPEMINISNYGALVFKYSADCVLWKWEPPSSRRLPAA